MIPISSTSPQRNPPEIRPWSRRVWHPGRSPELKLQTGGLVLQWVTMWEYQVLYVLESCIQRFMVTSFRLEVDGCSRLVSYQNGRLEQVMDA